MFYPGVPCGIDGPVASMRVKNLRDGMDDYEYLAILEKLAGRDVVLKFVNAVAPNWWAFSTDPARILTAREKIADQILVHRKAK